MLWLTFYCNFRARNRCNSAIGIDIFFVVFNFFCAVECLINFEFLQSELQEALSLIQAEKS